jgi:hypothetical protein
VTEPNGLAKLGMAATCRYGYQQMLLWELYCDQPRSFLDMLQRKHELYFDRIPSWLRRLPSPTYPSTPSLEDGTVGDAMFQKLWGTVEEMKKINKELSQHEAGVKLPFKQIEEKYHSRKEGDECFKRYLGELEAVIDSRSHRLC